jgi:hypothetical protein
MPLAVGENAVFDCSLVISVTTPALHATLRRLSAEVAISMVTTGDSHTQYVCSEFRRNFDIAEMQWQHLGPASSRANTHVRSQREGGALDPVT